MWYTTLSRWAFTHKTFREACIHAKDYFDRWGNPEGGKIKLSKHVPAGAKVFDPSALRYSCEIGHFEGEVIEEKATKGERSLSLLVKGPKKVATGYEQPIAAPLNLIDQIVNGVVRGLRARGIC